MACITARDFRWENCDIKSTSLLGNVLARQISADPGAIETILLRDGLLTEASASNVWVVKKARCSRRRATTCSRHPLRPPGGALRGTASVKLRPITEAELPAADEVWLTSSTKEVLAVTTLDGKPSATGRGKPGPLFKRMHALFQEPRRRRAPAGRSPAGLHPPGRHHWLPWHHPARHSRRDRCSRFRAFPDQGDGAARGRLRPGRDRRSRATSTRLRRRRRSSSGRAAAPSTWALTITVNATSREQLDELYRSCRSIRWSRWSCDASRRAWRLGRVAYEPTLGRCRRSTRRAAPRRRTSSGSSSTRPSSPWALPAGRARARRRAHPGGAHRSRRPGHLSRSRPGGRLPADRPAPRSASTSRNSCAGSSRRS